MLNYYDVLEVSQNASVEVIRAAYKSLMQRHHPDKHPENAAGGQRAALIVEAYEILSDAEKRASFDRKLRAWRRQDNVAPRSSRHHGVSGAKSARPIWLVALAALTAITYFARDAWHSFRAGEKPVTRLEKQVETGHADAAPLVIARQLDIRLSNSGQDGAGKGLVLHVPRITLKIAANAEGIRQRVKEVKAEIGPALEKGLARASYSNLIAPDGEAYLGTLVVDALVQVMLANSSQEVQAELLVVNFNNILEVGLPESYSVQPQ